MYVCLRHICLIAAFIASVSVQAYGHGTVSRHTATPAAPCSIRPDSTATLPEAEVTVSAAAPGVVAPQTLHGADLEKLNAHSVADALRYFSGVQIKDYGGVGGVKTIDIRSMGSHHTGVFYDGLQLGNAQNGQIDLGRYSLDNIEEISLYNGQKSRIFQPARDFAAGSAIYIRSRRPRFDAGRRFNLTARFRTGSFGLVNPGFNADWKVSDAVALTASAEYTYATGRYRFRYRKMYSDGTVAWDTTATRRNGDIHALRLEAGAYGTMNRGQWQAKAYYYDSDRGIPGAIVNNVWKNSQRQWDRNFFVQGSLQRRESERYEWMANAKYARDRMRYLNPDTTLMYIDNTFHQDELYISTTHKLTIIPGWDAALAADWVHNYLSSDMTNFLFPRRDMLLGSVATSLDIGDFKAQGGLLINYVRDTRLRNPADRHGPRDPKSWHRLTPSVFVAWAPAACPELSLHAFFKQIFRMPTFNDLYYTDIGNAELRPERATQWDLGAAWSRSGICGPGEIRVSADGYYNLISDKIIAVPKGTGQYRWMMMNIGRVRILGAEANADLTVFPLHALGSPASELRLHGRFSYTYQRARDYSDPADCLDAAGTYKGQIAYIPLHSFSIAADAEWRDLRLNYSFIYAGKRWQNSSNIPENLVQPWYTHDISAAYTLRLRHCQAGIQLEVNNLLDQQYEVIANYPMPGRNYRLTLSFIL